MRRTIAVIGMASVSLLLLASMFWALSAFGSAPRRPDWQVAMQRYLSFLSAEDSSSYSIVSAQEALKPWAMDAASAGVTFGDSVAFATDHHYAADRGGSLDLPYPPIDVWCIHYSGAGVTRLAVVGQHETLYYVDWVVHEKNMEPTSASGRVLLKKLGCE